MFETCFFFFGEIHVAIPRALYIILYSYSVWFCPAKIGSINLYASSFANVLAMRVVNHSAGACAVVTDCYGSKSSIFSSISSWNALQELSVSKILPTLYRFQSVFVAKRVKICIVPDFTGLAISDLAA